MTEALKSVNTVTINTVNPLTSVDFRPFLEGIATIDKKALLVWVAFVDEHFVVPALVPGYKEACGYVLSEKDVRFVKTMLIKLMYEYI